MDSLVVCRLRKNSEFRQNNNNPNRDSQTRRMNNSNCAVSEGGTDQTGMAEGDKAIEASSKKCSSSNDSYSIEQNDSASEAELKFCFDANPTVSSSHQTDFLGEEDFYADILKDDIIKLDETSLSTIPVLPPVDASQQETAGNSQQNVEPFLLPEVPFQGTANRRIRLRKQKVGLYHFCEPFAGKTTSQDSKCSPPCLLTTFANKSLHKRLVCVAFGILTLLALFFYLLRGFCPVKNFNHATVNKYFCH